MHMPYSLEKFSHGLQNSAKAMYCSFKRCLQHYIGFGSKDDDLDSRSRDDRRRKSNPNKKSTDV